MFFVKWIIPGPDLGEAFQIIVGRMDDRFDSPEAPHSAMGEVQMIVAVFDVVLLLIAHQEVADAALLQGCQSILLAPDAVDFV